MPSMFSLCIILNNPVRTNPIFFQPASPMADPHSATTGIIVCVGLLFTLILACFALLGYLYLTTQRSLQTGFKAIADLDARVHILEHPIIRNQPSRQSIRSSRRK